MTGNENMIRKLTAVFAILACLGLAGCGFGGKSVDIDYHSPLAAKLSALKGSGQSAPLRILTDFDWDEVHLFHEGASKDVIEKAVGSPVIRGKYFDSSASLLVFTADGAVVRAIGVTGDYLRGEGEGAAAGEPRFDFPSDVLVEPWGNGALRLTLPPS